MLVRESLKPLGYVCMESLAEWQAHRSREEPRLAARWLISQHLAAAQEGNEFPGFCALCQQSARFSINGSRAVGEPWCFRDDATCSGCGLFARIRLGFELLQQLGNPGPASRIYLTEQLGRAFQWLLQKYPGTVGSEFADSWVQRRRLQKELDRVYGGAQILRHEDATALSFADQSLDALLSFDVLEHVPDYQRALSEFARVLRPGGLAILTAPFLDSDQSTITRARIGPTGEIEHLLPAEYHGDPAQGSDQVLCYYHFGWDILDSMRAAGFSQAYSVLAWSLHHGLPSLSFIWVAIR